MDLAEVLEMGEKVLQGLDEDHEELRLLKEIRAVQIEIQSLKNQTAADIKDTITAMTARLKEDEVEDDEERQAEAQQLKEAMEAMKTGQRSLEKECQSIRQKVQGAQQQQQQLRQERLALKESSAASLSKHRYDVNLYTQISNIRWQCDGPADEVQGYVCTKSTVKPFLLSKSKVSPMFITNYLWDLIEDKGW